MKQSQLDVMVAFFAYAGNGGFSSQLPQIGQWWARTYHEMATDPRIGRVACQTFSDTPVTMTRNQAVEVAKSSGFDVLIMIDSDNEIDLYNQSWFKSSFEFLYQRKLNGLPTVVFAPYCGPPPHPTRGGEENVYVFKWVNFESDTDFGGWKLMGYDRDEAAQLTGIKPAGAGPTGCIMYSLDAFELQAVPHFYYEWKDETASQKNSTEDVTNTRDISMMGWEKFKQDVVFCNWDCWAGHHKPKCVGKPHVINPRQVSSSYAKSILNHYKVIDIDFTNTDTPKPENASTPVDTSDTCPILPNLTNGDANGSVERATKVVRRVKKLAKSVGSHRIMTIGDPCPPEKLQVIEGVARAIKSASPLRIVQAYCCKVGEETLALTNGAPGSTVYCLDDWGYACRSGVSAEEMKERFKQNIGDKLDNQVRVIEEFPAEPQGVDLIVARCPYDELPSGSYPEQYGAFIRGFMRHLAPHGLLLGVGLSTGQDLAMKDIEHRVLPQFDMWLIEKAKYGVAAKALRTDE